MPQKKDARMDLDTQKETNKINDRHGGSQEGQGGLEIDAISTTHVDVKTLDGLVRHGQNWYQLQRVPGDGNCMLNAV
jgi:hypothetical protein